MIFTIEGTVTSGFGRGKEFITIEGYTRQFRERLGYEPYPGTLNLEVSQSDGYCLRHVDPICIDGWEEGESSFGAVYCYPASTPSYENTLQLHAITPKRTDHDESTIELISDINLRNTLGLSDGDVLEIRLDTDIL